MWCRSHAALVLAIALPFALAPGEGRAQESRAREPASESPFELRAGNEIAIFVAASAAWALPSLFQDEFAPGSCAPCDPDDVNAFDRTAIGFDSGGARIASHVGAAALPVLAELGALLGARDRGFSEALGDGALVAESILVAGAVNVAVKNLVARPRPYMYDPELAIEHGRGREGFVSFYSGHTSLVFSAVASFATIFTVRHPKSAARFAVWGLGLSAAAVVGILRVLGGAHFWTDVIAGAGIGGGIGAAVPLLHLRRDSRGRGKRRAAATAVAGPGYAAVHVIF